VTVLELAVLRDEGIGLFETLHLRGVHDDAARRSPLISDPDMPAVREWAVRVGDTIDDPLLRGVFYARGIAANPHTDRTPAQHELWDRLTQLNKIIEELMKDD